MLNILQNYSQNNYLKNTGLFELLDDFVNGDVFWYIDTVNEELHLQIFLEVKVRVRNVFKNQFFADMW